MDASAVSIRGLVKDFAVGLRGVKLRAVDGLDLEIGRNEVFGLLGPNGSGKSTTIKVILGLLRPSEGACFVYGKPAKAVSARREVGFLPEAPYFYRYLSGTELVRFYARICGVAKDSLERRVREVVALVGMASAAERRVGTYSKGMLQRIGLAQALVHDPALVILDEPTAGVDPIGAADIANIVRRLKEEGKTVLLSSHLLAQVEGVCDRVAILHQGRLLSEGRVADLVEAPDSVSFVAEGLDEAGCAAVGETIRARGGTLKRVEAPKLSLDAFFLRQVSGRGDAAAAGGDQVASRATRQTAGPGDDGGDA
mgnify:CR=1 FL=1